MNGFWKDIYTSTVQGIKDHPIQSVVTLLTSIGVIFTIVSNTHVDLYVTSQEVKANAEQIQQLSNTVSNDHSNIVILQQIAKDNVNAEQNLANQVAQLNTTFTDYLLNKIK